MSSQASGKSTHCPWSGTGRSVPGSPHESLAQLQYWPLTHIRSSQASPSPVADVVAAVPVSPLVEVDALDEAVALPVEPPLSDVLEDAVAVVSVAPSGPQATTRATAAIDRAASRVTEPRSIASA